LRPEGYTAFSSFTHPMTLPPPQSHTRLLVSLSAESHLPTIYGNRTFTEAGGLMSYQGSFVTLYRRAASVVDKILKGAKPADIPVEQSTQIDLIINLKTAKALGLTIPKSLLQRADEVIQ